MTASGAAEVPVQPAATLMLVDDRPDLQVLMLRRRRGSAFVGGGFVFPGGCVEAADAGASAEAMCAGLSPADADQRLGLPSGGLAYWVAALRETFEEAGVLLARDSRSGRQLDLSDPAAARRFAAHREAVDSGTLSLAQVVGREGLALALDELFYAARWITPPGRPRRYDTRFFLARQPAGQTPQHDRREAVHSAWMRPGEALERCARGELAALPPTLGMLRILSGFAGAAEALAAAEAQQDRPDRVVRIVRAGGRVRALLPGDAEYEGGTADGLEAWIRLWPPGGAPPEPDPGAPGGGR
jgi:8-oxo-dGTP pyrophosphatase MutT (NUDIX family)